MKIAIIGAGNVGAALGSALSRTGHSVVLTAADPEHATTVAAQVNAQAAQSNPEAVEGADVVILAVPHAATAEVAEQIKQGTSGTTIVDATNPLKPDYSGLATGERSAAEELQERLPDSSVVKAFNTVFAARQGEPVADGVALDGFVAGDDEAAKETVSQLLEALGYRPVDAGGLAAARALEHMAFLNISLNARNGWPWQTGWKLVGPTG